jgi:phytoene/squalene synthetase
MLLCIRSVHRWTLGNIGIERQRLEGLDTRAFALAAAAAVLRMCGADAEGGQSTDSFSPSVRCRGCLCQVRAQEGEGEFVLLRTAFCVCMAA